MYAALIALCVWLLWANPAGAVAISAISGGASDGTTPVPPPCATFGFSVEAMSTLPISQDNARMVRVDRSGNSQTGYVLTSQPTGYSVYAFDYKTMQNLGSLSVTPLGYRDAGRLQGDVSLVDGKLYVFYEVSTAEPTCPANRCLVMARWSGKALELTVIDTNAGAVQNIDDARESGSQFLVVMVNVGTRFFRTYDRASMTRTATGTDTGISDFGHIGRAMTNGIIMASIADNTTFPNIFRFTAGTPTASGTNSLSFTPGLGVAAVFPQQSTLTAFDSGNEASPQRAFVTGSTLTGPQNFPLTGANIGAAFQGAFYDPVNRKVFSLRRDNGVGTSLLLRSDLDPATSDERFTCPTCANSGGTTVGSQIVDYVPSYMRMYVGSNDSPSILSKIKVCATGGPP